MFGRGQHGVAGDFRAGARGSRDGDEGRRRRGQRLALPDDLQVIQRVAAIGEQRRDGFTRVDGAAAAYANHQIACGVTRALYALPDHRHGGFAADRKRLARDAQALQFEGTAHDKQRSPTHFRSRGGDLAHGAGAEDDACSRREFKAHAASTSPRRPEKY